MPSQVSLWAYETDRFHKPLSSLFSNTNHKTGVCLSRNVASHISNQQRNLLRPQPTPQLLRNGKISTTPKKEQPEVRVGKQGFPAQPSNPGATSLPLTFGITDLAFKTLRPPQPSIFQHYGGRSKVGTNNRIPVKQVSATHKLRSTPENDPIGRILAKMEEMAQRQSEQQQALVVPCESAQVTISDALK